MSTPPLPASSASKAALPPPATVSITAGIATVTIDRPQRGNALDAATVDALARAFEALAANEDVHTWALRGAGPQFCTGFDFTDLDRQSDGDLLERFVRVELMLQQFANAPARTVAFVQGRAFGAGADLFTACDARIVGPKATFGFPGPRFGLVLGTRRLALRIGPEQARRVLLEGLTLDALEALDIGLATQRWDGDFDALHATLARPVADPPTLRRLVAQARQSSDDEDLAAVVRSVIRPGLVARVRAYRDSIAKR